MYGILQLLHSEKNLSFKDRLLLYIVLSFIFAFIYNLMDHDEFRGFHEDSYFLDHLYYSVTTQATIGFGDISPISKRAKVVSMLHALMVFILFAL